MFSPPPAMVYVLVAASYVARPGPIVDDVPTSDAFVKIPSADGCGGTAPSGTLAASSTKHAVDASRLCMISLANTALYATRAAKASGPTAQAFFAIPYEKL
jgi:hypothetical protein